MSFEQILEDRFKTHPIPEAADLSLQNSSNPKIFRGKEARVVAVLNKHGEQKAFKWYARLEGHGQNSLISYANRVRTDEQLLLGVGLTKSQVPPSHFFISESERRPQLFSLQRWVKGRTLNEVPLTELLTNTALRSNLIDLFIKCGSISPTSGKFPDLVGVKPVKLGKLSFVDPLVFIWPFRTTNIMVEDDNVVLPDAKTISANKSFYKVALLKLHRQMTLIAARVLGTIPRLFVNSSTQPG